MPSPSSPDALAALAQRVVELEMQVTHQQRDIDAFHEVLLDQQRQIERLRAFVEKVGERVTQFPDDSLKADPVLDKPPHY